MASTQAPTPDDPGPGTAVVLTIGDTTVTGQLWDNPAARDLAARLPLTLTVERLQRGREDGAAWTRP